MNVPTWVWLVTVGLSMAFLLIDVFIIGRRPHEPSTGESARHLAFFVALAVLFGIGVWVLRGSAVRRRVLRRLAHRVQPVRGQPVHLHHHHVQVRRAPAVPADGAADRHHPGPGVPRHLHLRRRRRHQQLQLGLLPVRRVPRLHRHPPGARGARPARRTTTRTGADPLGADHLPATNEYHGVKPDGRRERQAADHPDGRSSWSPSAPRTCCSPWTRSRRSTGSPRSRTWC